MTAPYPDAIQRALTGVKMTEPSQGRAKYLGRVPLETSEIVALALEGATEEIALGIQGYLHSRTGISPMPRREQAVVEGMRQAQQIVADLASSLRAGEER